MSLKEIALHGNQTKLDNSGASKNVRS